MVEVFVALAIFSYCYFYAIVLAAAVEEPILEKIEKTYCALKALQGKYGGIHPAAVLRQSMSKAMFRSELPGAASDLGQFEDLFQVELPGAASRLWIVMKG